MMSFKKVLSARNKSTVVYIGIYSKGFNDLAHTTCQAVIVNDIHDKGAEVNETTGKKLYGYVKFNQLFSTRKAFYRYCIDVENGKAERNDI